MAEVQITVRLQNPKYHDLWIVLFFPSTAAKLDSEPNQVEKALQAKQKCIWYGKKKIILQVVEEGSAVNKLWCSAGKLS